MLQKSISNCLRNSVYIKDCRLTSLQNNHHTSLHNRQCSNQLGSLTWMTNFDRVNQMADVYKAQMTQKRDSVHPATRCRGTQQQHKSNSPRCRISHGITGGPGKLIPLH